MKYTTSTLTLLSLLLSTPLTAAFQVRFLRSNDCSGDAIGDSKHFTPDTTCTWEHTLNGAQSMFISHSDEGDNDRMVILYEGKECNPRDAKERHDNIDGYGFDGKCVPIKSNIGSLQVWHLNKAADEL
ncbi:hypothetical protein BU24DRAFT_446320 [Aaosphaeria arxii CBS 175.79]|uniref:Uncharacterized protein n=1 Tax=Aaosphaeria arxii CBS 175.79 TaxID=1450172 RepID=A0A6A5Y6S4_9PLEO|nr:uncharacterized protein BU24DRAFT_446320 [Aaosphaeria arxii CBS 175.79]KAF2021265.1 hypothetical protein BU24DRAFT_446320 [Aaosphaeria arxii CBS 175.79]